MKLQKRASRKARRGGDTKEEPAVLPFAFENALKILDGTKTQTSRKYINLKKIKPRAIFQGQVTHFADLRVIDVTKKKLGEFTEEDAKRSGGYTLKKFKEVWKRVYGKWDDNETVYVIRFKLAKKKSYSKDPKYYVETRY